MPTEFSLHPPVVPIFITSPFQLTGRTVKLNSGEVVTKPHKGVDLRAALGQPVYAAADGIVDRSYLSLRGPVDAKTGKPQWYAYGERIVLSHFGFSTSYAHLSKRLVQKGDVIHAGQLIGYAGNTGDSGGPHLHFEFLVHGKPEDPMPYMQQK